MYSQCVRTMTAAEQAGAWVARGVTTAVGVGAAATATEGLRLTLHPMSPVGLLVGIGLLAASVIIACVGFACYAVTRAFEEDDG